MLQLTIEYVQCYWQAFVMGMIFMSLLGVVYDRKTNNA
jgi:hypothetical protein